jgi:hypothetical protein
MILKVHTHDDSTSDRLEHAGMHPGQGAFGGRFGVCLIIMVLAVCGWVMHRRLSQYDAPQQAVHQSTSIKVCVTKRNPLSVPSMRGSEAFAVFLLALAFAAILNALGNSEAALALRVQSQPADHRANAGILSCMHHLFVLPPPARLSVL